MHHPPNPTTVVLPQTKHTDTGEMVLIPGDTYLKRAVADPMPSFYIDRTEVTNAAFQAYCMTLSGKRPSACESSVAHPDYPVANVTIGDAMAFAEFAHKRLPTMKEWERAALGVDGRAFPWGNQRDPGLANVSDNPTSKSGPVPADSFSEGDSPYGVRQMFGNVWEFVNDTKIPDPKNKDDNYEYFMKKDLKLKLGDLWYNAMGGSWYQPLVGGDIESSRTLVPFNFSTDKIGFRCVQDATQ
jgi:formylglycine-generating enzyme required for sulfatase activity